ncbi:MAG: hypothetical protein UT48_C0006G0029 [Parcubacteria group bacterium GW2011_GWE2_39_37]|uniref:Uncharacterized protein n=1 Tax=Candidatus Falkowbacteria bacterium GW2011_GWF2_39_8 TaxID=1618642 RepID=A0A0G0SGQ2_9BACT|nr:MAG: hypothetical protein UT48_C0006G0029 [Parcubacteria group bacterium GW2011_GWE2_39_37]KKR33890.1 MAG: hypothetical protein UT64_C0002G0029 [Candidatus Falkowbacteria bacterium GW2011_GWF2_39_8]
MSVNFFESIGIAGIERIHSQMIYWILKSDVLLFSQKNKIINELFKKEQGYKNIEIVTEHKSIDILIKADNCVFIIENKLKTSEHSSQLEKYKEVMTDDENFSGHDKYYYYLSLVNEDKTGTGWQNLSYVNFYEALRKFKFNNPNKAEQFIFNEYLVSLERLISVYGSFDLNHRAFANVFTDGSKTKDEKYKISKNYSLDQLYVLDNQLETIFQKYFIEKVAKKLNLNGNKYKIDESNGTALLQITFEGLNMGDATFIVGLQFQGRAVKLNCASDDYKNSKKEDLPKKICDIFEVMAECDDFRLNHSKTKAYISISEKEKMDSDLWQKPFDDICKIFNDKIKKFEPIAKKFCQSCKN